jgi:hypothetical protein
MMSIASDIIGGVEPDYDRCLQAGESLDDIDEYGFTPLIETVIARRPSVAEALVKRGVLVNKPDILGRTPLHWAVDQGDVPFVRFLLSQGADPNAYDLNGLSVLVYPVLRGQNELKHLLYQYGARLDFALDFICGKLIGHRFELRGDADIVNAAGEFIELDYEGFILEFTVAVVKDSLRRFTSSYSTRHLRHQFPYVYAILDGFVVAAELLKFQHQVVLTDKHWERIGHLLKAPMLILPAASRGHAMCFVRYGSWWAKIDRGENSLKEGSVNIYHMTKPEALTVNFIHNFLYKRQPRSYFHKTINAQLGLKPAFQLPVSPQISGNCSWANVQAVIPVAYALQQLNTNTSFSPDEAMDFFKTWTTWDQDRAVDDGIQRFYLADKVRRASLAGMLGAVLFHACDASNPQHLLWAEKILPILTLPDYYYILHSYLKHYCEKRLTRRGNNFLKLLDDCGVNPNIDVTPIATGLNDRDKK